MNSIKKWISSLKFLDGWNHNLGYKLVSLIIAVLLWVLILGKRDYVSTKMVDVDLLISEGFERTSDIQHIKVQVAGPRMALKKFIESSVNQLLVLDLTDKGEGEWLVNIPEEKLELPFGVRLLSVTPSYFKVQLKKKKDSFLKPKDTID